MNTSHLEKPLGPLQKYAYLLLRTNHSIKIGRFTIFIFNAIRSPKLYLDKTNF